jgi:spore germination protein KA
MNDSTISTGLAANKTMLDTLFAKCDDYAVYDFLLEKPGKPACLFYFNGLTDKKAVNSFLQALSAAESPKTESVDWYEWVRQHLDHCHIYKTASALMIADGLLSGETALFLDQYAECIMVGSSGLETRQISEPVTEGVVKGPREGFTESIVTNLTLLRRKVKTPALKMERYILGANTKTEIRISYVEGIASDPIVQEVRRRILDIKADSILESQYIEEAIEDETFTLFPQMDSTERPDKVAAAVLTGKIAIFVDGTPFVIIVPVIMANFFLSTEDYYQRYPFAFFIRPLRYAAAVLSFLLPAIYISITTFHQEMVPTPLMISIVNSYENVPFPLFFEALLLEITFEVLREAGIRLPRTIGQAVSIVGGLVIGQAAVQAGLVSYGMVIVVSLTGIMSFVIPSYSMAITLRLLRFVFMIIGSTLGMYGVLLGLLILHLHLASLRSFGLPYLSPFGPAKLKDMTEILGRLSWKAAAKDSKTGGQS